MGRKANEWTFQSTNKQNLTWQGLDMAKKGKPIREIESLLQAAQNNDTMINNVGLKIDKMQQNSLCLWCSDKRISHMINKCCKFAQKE